MLTYVCCVDCGLERAFYNGNGKGIKAFARDHKDHRTRCTSLEKAKKDEDYSYSVQDYVADNLTVKIYTHKRNK